MDKRLKEVLLLLIKKTLSINDCKRKLVVLDRCLLTITGDGIILILMLILKTTAIVIIIKQFLLKHVITNNLPRNIFI